MDRREIEALQISCSHKEVSQCQCMPFRWTPGCETYCVGTCNNCGIELFTTHKGNPIGKDVRGINGEEIIVWETKNTPPKEKFFICPERKDCRFHLPTGYIKI